MELSAKDIEAAQIQLVRPYMGGGGRRVLEYP